MPRLFYKWGMETTNTAAVEKGRRYNGKCGCGSKFSILAVSVPFVGPEKWIGSRHEELLATDGYNYTIHCWGALYRCACGKVRTAKPVIGTYKADKKCDGRCLAATGHSCECSCGGKNHGAGAVA